MDKRSMCCPCGEKINLLAVTTANAIAADKSVEEIDLLSSFFSLLGDALGVISASRAMCEANKTDEKDDTTGFVVAR